MNALSRRVRRPFLALGAAAGAWVLTLSLGAAPDAPGPLFSHTEHAARDATACIGCHDPKHSVGEAPKLLTEACLECHDEPPVAAPRRSGGALSIPFLHAPHADQACATCHRDVEPAEGTRDADHLLVVDSALCLSCHQKSPEAPREQQCARCHARDERHQAPASHTTTWPRAHGANLVPAPFAEHGMSCTLCHREASCASCHRVESPRDHTGLWRMRTHGVAAAWDRARCKTCHEPASCESCHRSEEPLNHRGAWTATHGLVAQGRNDTSCMVCHRPSFCIECHRGNK